MVRHYKVVINGFIVAIGTGKGFQEISKDEYETILAKIEESPGYNYALNDSTLEWEYAESEEEDAESDSE